MRAESAQFMNPEHQYGKRYAKDDSIVSRRIGSEFLLVPIRKTKGEVDSIFSLNEVAARVWELIDGTKFIRDISAVIAGEYDVDPDRARKDVIELVTQLEGVGAVKEVPNGLSAHP